MNVNIISTLFLEHWSKDIDKTGQGGSELAHVYMAREFTRLGHTVKSYIPDPSLAYGKDIESKSLTYLEWDWIGNVRYEEKANWLIFRDPTQLDKPHHPESNLIYISQDIDSGGWTQTGLARLDKFITLCPTHAEYTINKYFSIKEKVFVSSNGICSEKIADLQAKVERKPLKIVYTSSPDRGLLTILNNWFRVRERVREAELHVFYGRKNLQLLAKTGNWRYVLDKELEKKLQQPGIINHGRVSQEVLWTHIAEANVWWYPCSFPETSCISCLEAQALGAIPVTNTYWALGTNILHGFQTLDLTDDNKKTDVCQQIEWVIELLRNPSVAWREEMMIDARDSFNWSEIIKQYENWLK